ncbi:uncharacterized protein LOC111025446 [Momordica charantia]|uniref:Uncharacterized protein LOC111025446 n=1 Tax=Momordica charantia TaxID=3673 RepID=A0A6J1E2L3_MOMCH|nr:uncharacterized protein LOC111025446 [Momordica charantia]
MSCFRLPKKFINELHQVAARFWWRSGGEDKKIHWLGWNTLRKPKFCGGMGFRDLELFNKALLAKQSWRILNNPDSVLAKVLKGRYFRNCDLLQAEIRGSPSFIWRSLVWGSELLKDGLRWRIGNGENVNVYRDNWVPNQPSLKILSARRLPIESTVHSLINHDLAIWKVDEIEAAFSPDEAKGILSIPLGSRNRRDKLIWHYEKMGVYTVKSGYRIAVMKQPLLHVSSSSSETMTSWWKGL